MPKQQYTCVVECENGEIRLLELSEEHQAVAKRLLQRGLDAIGSFVLVKLSTDGDGTRDIELQPDRVQTKPIPCRNYLEQIGRKQYLLAQQLKFGF